MKRAGKMRIMLRRLKMLKQRICCCVFNIALIVFEYFLSKAFCLYLSKKLLIAFLRTAVRIEKMHRKIVQSRVCYNVILNTLRVKFVEVGKWGTGFRLSLEPFVLVKNLCVLAAEA